MLTIKDLPTSLTEYDLENIERHRRDLDYSNKLYSLSTVCLDIEIEKITPDLIADIKVIRFSLGAKDNKAIHCFKDVDLKESTDLRFLPTMDKQFQSYKSELEVIPFFLDGRPNVSNSNLVEHLKERFDESPSVVLSNCSLTGGLVMCPVTGTYLTYDLEAEHPYEVDLQGETYFFDSLNIALKPLYEWAKAEGYTPKPSRDLQARLDEYMKTPEFKASIEKLKEDMEQKESEQEEFYNSDLHKELTLTIKNYLHKKSRALTDFDIQHGGVNILTMEEFNLIISSVFAMNETTEDTEATFYTVYIELDGLRYEQVSGQGTISSITLC